MCRPRLRTKALCQIECIRPSKRGPIRDRDRDIVCPPRPKSKTDLPTERCASRCRWGALCGGTCFLNQPTPPPAARTPGTQPLRSLYGASPPAPHRLLDNRHAPARPPHHQSKTRRTLATVCAARVSGQVDASAAGKSAVDEPVESREEWRAIEPRKGSYWRSLSSLSRPSAVTRQAICCAWSPKTGTPRLGPSKKRNLAAAQQVTEEV